MLRGYTVKLYPNKSQEALLNKHFGCTRAVYNMMIVINQKRYHRTGKGMSGFDMQSYLPKLKKQYPWLAEVNSQSLQIVCHNLADAYGRFFKKQSGYPCFKKKSPYGSFTCINGSTVTGNHIKLPKLGKIRFRGGDMLDGKIKRFTVKAKAGKYYASILIDTLEAVPEPLPFQAITGLDVGLTDTVVTSYGGAFPAPKYARRARQKLKLKQQALSRCKKGSNRRKKRRLEVARLHDKISNQRKDYHHKITRSLVADGENQAFAVEDLAIRNMMQNHCLAGAITDAGWYQFLSFLRYKSEAVGKQVLQVGRFFPSSKTCSSCGVVKQSLPLSVREWTCGDCGAVHHRDVNAAINIALEALRNRASGDGISPVVRLASVYEARICI